MKCCAVRDLLPAYLENLTEEETALLIQEHLETCDDCRKLAELMGAALPEERTEKKLRFLSRMRNTRLLGAMLSLAITLMLVLGLYNMEFHYSNTVGGRLAALADYMVAPEDDWDAHIPYGTNVRVIAHMEQGRFLWLYYGTDTEDNVQGFMKLERGINGKYRPCHATMSPYPYTAGVRVFYQEDGIVFLGGENCDDIAAVRLELRSWDGITEPKFHDVEVPRGDFLMAVDLSEPIAAAGGEEYGWRVLGEKAYLDENGNDITDQYRLDVEQNWAGSKGSAEQGMVYVFIGLVIGVGVLFIRYFLTR